MNLTSKKIIKNLLKKYRTRPSKRLGQNFLIDKSVIRKIINATNIQPGDSILEIGPGIGVLTQQLAKKAKKVIVIEKDPKLIEILTEVLKDYGNVDIIEGDILKTQISKLKTKNYKIVANLPYYIVSPVIRKFLELADTGRPQLMVVMIQREVAQRICACPPKPRKAGRRRAKPLRLRQGYGGQAKMNLLAVSVRFYADPKIISYVSKKSLWPQPKVDGAIIKIVPRQFRVPVSLQFRERFFRIVRAGFSQPRKQISNNLVNKLKLKKEVVKNWLLKNGIQPSQRAETLTVEDWISLTKNFKV